MGAGEGGAGDGGGATPRDELRDTPTCRGRCACAGGGAGACAACVLAGACAACALCAALCASVAACAGCAACELCAPWALCAAAGAGEAGGGEAAGAASRRSISCSCCRARTNAVFSRAVCSALSARLTLPETHSSQRRRCAGAAAKVASWRRAGGRSQRHTAVKSHPHCAHTAGTDERGMRSSLVR